MNQDKHSNCLKETKISKVQWTEIEKNHLSSESHETQENLRENTIIPKHSSSMKGYVSASIFRDFNFSLKFPKLLRFLDFPFIVL